MNVRVEICGVHEPEIVLRCGELTPELDMLVKELGGGTLLAIRDGQKRVLDPFEVMYVETVDDRTFLYTMDDVLQARYRLYELERLLPPRFIRIGKSHILNIAFVRALESQASGRLKATLENGEVILISRQYAKLFRQRLRERTGG